MKRCSDIPILTQKRDFYSSSVSWKEQGILKQLEELGIQEGDTVRMYGLMFDYYK